MIVGLSGFARSGKDSFYKMSRDLFLSKGKSSIKYAFADSLKEECYDFLLKNTGISSFTDSDNEKEIIRPFLVTYGTDVRRRMNPECWIEKVKSKIENEKNKSNYEFITDVRYENEASWVISQGGFNIYISRANGKPANSEEKKNDDILRGKCKYSFRWNNFTDMEKGGPISLVSKFWESINYGYG